MNATATTSVTGYVVDFYIPSDLTVETIRVPEFVDSEGNSVERLITINGQHPSILNKTIFLYDKIGSFQMVVYIRENCSGSVFLYEKLKKHHRISSIFKAAVGEPLLKLGMTSIVIIPYSAGKVNTFP